MLLGPAVYVGTSLYLRGSRRLGGDDDDGGDDGMSFEIDSGNKGFDAFFLWFFIAVLVSLSALFSGLTLGLLGLDKNGLDIARQERRVGDGREYAKLIFPVRQNGNRLLCTLLLGNVAVNALLSITLAAVASSIVGFLMSTALIVVFGEILPQALCSRHALYIGASTLPVVKLFMVLMSPIAFPLAWALDALLGEDVGTVHTKREMLQYMKVHLRQGILDDESGNVMRGALEMKEKSVHEVMTPLEDVFMLPESTTLSFKVVREIFEQGFSRVPVFRGERQHIVGLLFVKDLIFVDPEDETPLASLLSIFSRGLQVVDETNTLDDVLRIFKRGHGHLALVRRGDAPRRTRTTSGGDAPAKADAARRPSTARRRAGTATTARRGQRRPTSAARRLDAEFVDERLSLEEVQAVTAHFMTNVRQLNSPANEDDGSRLLNHDEMSALVRRSRVVELRRRTKNAHADVIKDEDKIYVRGEAAAFATLVLNGKLSVLAGKDGFRAEAGPWSVLGADALTAAEGSFVPDFSAHVATESVRCIYVHRAEYARAVRAGALGGADSSNSLDELRRGADLSDADCYAAGISGNERAKNLSVDTATAQPRLRANSDMFESEPDSAHGADGPRHHPGDGASAGAMAGRNIMPLATVAPGARKRMQKKDVTEKKSQVTSMMDMSVPTLPWW
ncbi:hypothetical protein JL721_5556 [Aureococcus anophagefferens]|nr:hypothetical protein JL721_5556 [Aureococcus anophagefferens]